jgi:hypothetical protein
MRTYIPLNTICADGRSIALRRTEAFLEHRDREQIRLTMAEMQHLATCPTCNPDLRVNAMLVSLWGPEVRVRE